VLVICGALVVWEGKAVGAEAFGNIGVGEGWGEE